MVVATNKQDFAHDVLGYITPLNIIFKGSGKRTSFKSDIRIVNNKMNQFSCEMLTFSFMAFT